MIQRVHEYISERCGRTAAMWDAVIRCLLDEGFPVHELRMQDTEDRTQIVHRASGRVLVTVFKVNPNDRSL